MNECWVVITDTNGNSEAVNYKLDKTYPFEFAKHLANKLLEMGRIQYGYIN